MESSREMRREGSSTRFANIAIKRVTATRPHKAWVPPKFEDKKTENPKNKTMEV
jgi:hypothetical protein